MRRVVLVKRNNIIIRVSPEEKQQIKDLAKEHSMSISEYLIKSALSDKEIVIKEEITKDITIKVSTNDFSEFLTKLNESDSKVEEACNNIQSQDITSEEKINELKSYILEVENIVSNKICESLDTRKKIKKAAEELLKKISE